MPTAKMTSKGQITIPVEIRKALGLKSGDRINFVETDPGIYTLRPRTGSIMDMEGCLPKPDHPISIEEMNQAVLERAAELDTATMSGAKQEEKDGEAA